MYLLYYVSVNNDYGTTNSANVNCSTGFEAPQFVNIKSISNPPGYAAEISWTKSNGARYYKVYCTYQTPKATLQTMTAPYC